MIREEQRPLEGIRIHREVQDQREDIKQIEILLQELQEVTPVQEEKATVIPQEEVLTDLQVIIIQGAEVITTHQEATLLQDLKVIHHQNHLEEDLQTTLIQAEEALLEVILQEEVPLPQEAVVQDQAEGDKEVKENNCIRNLICIPYFCKIMCHHVLL